MLTLSILDQSPIPEGSTRGDALRNTIDLARLADRLGYKRYWVAEHHGSPGLACASPEALIGPIAEATARIRVGSGGVMLPHYSPLKVAETFGMLSSLFPERIDLGVGRAAGTSPNVAFALQRDRRQAAPDDFIDQLAELLGYLKQPGSADPWLLGSSPQSAIWAAELGLPYVFADFINPNGSGIAAYYRQQAQSPQLAVAAWVICADSDAEALRLSLSLRMMGTLLQRGRLIPVPTVEKAERFFAEEKISPETLPPGRRIIAGSPPVVRAALEWLAAEYGAQEALIVNIMHEHAARRRSYELIARVFDLS